MKTETRQAAEAYATLLEEGAEGGDVTEAACALDDALQVDDTLTSKQAEEWADTLEENDDWLFVARWVRELLASN